VAGLPTFNRGVADHQYLFVNGRPVKDRLLVGAVRGAYADMLARDRHAVLALFLDFRRGSRRQRPPGQDRSALPRSGLRARVHRRGAAPCAGQRRAAQRAGAGGPGHGALAGRTDPAGRPAPALGSLFAREYWRAAVRDAEAGAAWRAATRRGACSPAGARRTGGGCPSEANYPLGVARGQVANTYIVAEAEDGLVIVDQHAAHERLVLERLRRPARG
jgi:DNA mismatch repair protein MutL